MPFHLVRGKSSDTGTFGVFYDRNKPVCLMLELPDRGNAPNLSRIPASRYRVEYLERSASGRFKDCYLVLDVAARTWILIHSGNLAGDTKKGFMTNSYGCLLPATYIGNLHGQSAGLASRTALNSIHQATGRKSFWLTITQPQS